MKRALQLTAGIALLGTALFWAVAGSNLSWTKTSVPVKTTDEITGIEGITYERRFVPGVDFLAAGVLGAALLGGLSFFFNRQTKLQTTQNYK